MRAYRYDFVKCLVTVISFAASPFLSIAMHPEHMHFSIGSGDGKVSDLPSFLSSVRININTFFQVWCKFCNFTFDHPLIHSISRILSPFSQSPLSFYYCSSLPPCEMVFHISSYVLFYLANPSLAIYFFFLLLKKEVREKFLYKPKL